MELQCGMDFIPPFHGSSHRQDSCMNTIFDVIFEGGPVSDIARKRGDRRLVVRLRRGLHRSQVGKRVGPRVMTVAWRGARGADLIVFSSFLSRPAPTSLAAMADADNAEIQINIKGALDGLSPGVLCIHLTSRPK
jgi:hypothetical protein